MGFTTMGTITEIEREVEGLGPDELAKFRESFAEFNAARWDRQIEQDVAPDKLDRFADEALDDFREGRCKDL
jgi:hypothetical protein